jgi:predicted Zn-dependent peptidase
MDVEVKGMASSNLSDPACGLGTQIMVLSNGLTVVAEQMPSVRSVAIGVWVLAGSRHERPEEQGISHFLEHLMFKGTERRSAREIAEVMDQVGGQLNAFTTKEYTCYHARVLDDHLPLAIDVLADMLRSSLLREDDIEREKGVILEEIGMYQDAPDELVHDLFAQALWGEHPLGRSVLGTPATVQSLDRDRVRAYLSSAYTPEGSVVAVAGSFDPERLVGLLEEAFGTWGGDRARYEGPRPVTRVTTMTKAKETELVHVCMGGEGLPLADDGIYSLNIMSNILGGGPSSRLFQEVREQRGLAYSVFSYTSAFRDGGVFAVYCGSGQERIGQAVEVIGDQLRRLASEGVDDVELYRAKEQLKSNITMALESTGARMNRIGRSQLLLNKISPIDEVLTRIQGVTVESIRGLASRFCDPDRLAVVAIGPAPDRLDLRSALKSTVLPLTGTPTG